MIVERIRVFEVEICPYDDVPLEETFAVWETLLTCCDKLLRYSSQQMLREHGDVPRDLLRSLIKVADLTTHLEIVYADIHRFVLALMVYDAARINFWVGNCGRTLTEKIRMRLFLGWMPSLRLRNS